MALLAVSSLAGQEPPATDVLDLPVFEVKSEQTVGYQPTASVVASGFALETVKNPINIAALSKEFLNDLKFEDLADAVGYVASAQKSPNSDGSFHGSRIQVRGFDTAWFNRNGVRRYLINGTDNLDRLEVIKGPAAVFFGQAAPGGVVNYVTKRPSFVPENTLEVRYGSYDYFFLEAASQGAVLDSDKLAYRIDASYTDKKDWRDFEYQRRSFLYGGLRWQPLRHLRFYAEYERIQDKNNDALGLPQGNPVWMRDFLAIPDADNEVTNYYAANPAKLGLPANATRDEVINGARRTVGGRVTTYPGLRQRWQNRDPNSPGGNVRWRGDSIAAWTGLGRSQADAEARFPAEGRIVPEASPYGWEWNNLGQAGWVDHDLENISLEGTWDATSWFSLRAAAVWDNAYRRSFLRNEQSIGSMTVEGPALGLQKLTPDGLFNESRTFVAQGVFQFETGPAFHTVLAGWDHFQDKFLSVAKTDASTPAGLPDWNYFTEGYPEQSFGDSTIDPVPGGVTGERTSYTGNYIVRLWDSRLVGMAGLRRETFQSWGSPGKPTGKLGFDLTQETPSYGLVWETLPGINLFGSRSESFNAWGPNAATVNRGVLTDTQFAEYEARLGDARWPSPVTGEGFDLGVKLDLLDHRVSGTLSFYQVNEIGRYSLYSEELTLADPLNAEWLAAHPGAAARDLPIQRNVIYGEAEVQGLDLDLSILPTNHWMILLAYAYNLQAEVEQASGPALDIVAMPRHSYSIWTKYAFREGPLQGLSLGLGANGKTEYLLRPLANNYRYFEDGFIVCDAMVQYEFDLGRDRFLTLSLNVKNVFDERYFSGGASAPGDVRRAILSARYRF